MSPWFRRRESTVNINVTLKYAHCRRKRAKVERVPFEVVIPTDLLLGGWRQLFPAERMVVFGGQPTSNGIVITSLVDVTEANPTAAHVRAHPDKLAQALLDFERTGAHFAMWLHSHPGEGPRSTQPSHIDIAQEVSLREFYSDRLISLIAVKDGWLRVWGHNALERTCRLRWRGRGLETSREDVNVYRLQHH